MCTVINFFNSGVHTANFMYWQVHKTSYVYCRNKKIRIKKIEPLKEILGSKIFLTEKKFFDPKFFLPKTIFGPKKIFGPKRDIEKYYIFIVFWGKF